MDTQQHIIDNKEILLEISEKFKTPTFVYFEEILEENVQKYFDASIYAFFCCLHNGNWILLFNFDRNRD